MKTIHTDRSGEVTVCVLTSQKDWLSCLWSLVSFYEFSGLRVPLLVYSDGTLGERHARELGRVFPDARLVHAGTGGGVVASKLASYPNCMKFRTMQPYARKIIDLPILGGSRHILILDSDVLFFSRPDDLIRHLSSHPSGRFVFQRDFQEAYFGTTMEIREKFDVDIAPCVNVGIVVADVSKFDYAKLERWLDQPALRNHPWAEQTLWAMLAGREQTVFLDQEYDVTLAVHIEPNKVAKHYVKPIRDYLYMEGIPYLCHCLEQRWH